MSEDEIDRYGNQHYDGPDAVLVGDTYVTPAEAAEYARAESEALGEPADSCEDQDAGNRLSAAEALARTCDDCGARPGVKCSWSCSSNWK